MVLACFLREHHDFCDIEVKSVTLLTGRSPLGASPEYIHLISLEALYVSVMIWPRLGMTLKHESESGRPGTSSLSVRCRKFLTRDNFGPDHSNLNQNPDRRIHRKLVILFNATPLSKSALQSIFSFRKTHLSIVFLFFENDEGKEKREQRYQRYRLRWQQKRIRKK